MFSRKTINREVDEIRKLTGHNKNIGFIKHTVRGDKEIYGFKQSMSPILMQQIGFLRNQSFKAVGGGVNCALDLDAHDTKINPYYQLFIWDPKTQEIDGAYRWQFMDPQKLKEEKYPLASSRFYKFSKDFEYDYAPYTAELGRSFLNVKYIQTVEGQRNLGNMLDELWQMIGTIADVNDEIKYFFGKVTFYPAKSETIRFPMYRFIHNTFGDESGLIKIRNTSERINYENKFIDEYLDLEEEIQKEIENARKKIILERGSNYLRIEQEANAQALTRNLRKIRQEGTKRNEEIPNLATSYLKLAKPEDIKTYDAVTHAAFGNTEELALLLTIDKIFPEKLKHFTPIRYEKVYSKE